MAPFLPTRQSTDDSASTQEHKMSRTIWVVVTVVAISLAFLTVVGIVAIKWYRGKTHHQAVESSPHRTKNDRLKRRKMSDLDRLEEEELQRQFMIRKSLASRTSSRADSELCQAMSEEQLDTAEEERPGSLKNDWKEWEANLHRERSRSFESHPAAEPPSKPWAYLTVPAPARAESPSRRLNRSPAPKLTPSPALPRIPSEESLNLKGPSPLVESQPSVNALIATPWEKPSVYVIGYDRLETSEN